MPVQKIEVDFIPVVFRQLRSWYYRTRQHRPSGLGEEDFPSKHPQKQDDMT